MRSPNNRTSYNESGNIFADRILYAQHLHSLYQAILQKLRNKTLAEECFYQLLAIIKHESRIGTGNLDVDGILKSFPGLMSRGPEEE